DCFQDSRLKTQDSRLKKGNSMSNDVQIEDVTTGQGAEAQVGSTITVHYLGTLADGTKFDSSYDRGEPISFGLNPGSLIEGWIEGIPGMKEGGKRKLSIPSAKGYGASGTGPIPPDADLI